MDDEPSLVRAVGGYLEHEGFVVTTAPDGEQALVAARSDPPDVTVLDLMVPGIDGLEVCRHLRTFSDAYVIMLTARSEEIDTLIGLSVGADDYLTKPFSPRELTARIRGLLRRPRMAGYTGEWPGTPASRFIERVWGPGWVGEEHLVDIHIAHIRAKVGDDPARTRPRTGIQDHPADR